MSKFKDVSRVDELLKALELISSKEIEIGIFESEFKDNQGNLTVYGKALVNEYGASIEIDLKDGGKSVINIPERSFIRSSFDNNSKKIYNSIDDMLGDILDGKLTPQEMFAIIGENCVRIIDKHIKSSIPPPNSPLTLANKKTDRTLVDTGEMLKSLDWRIVDRK